MSDCIPPPPPPPIIAGLKCGPTFFIVRCGAGAGLNIEGCGAVRAPALNDCAVRCGCGPLHCGAVQLRAKLLGPRRALICTCWFDVTPSTVLAGHIMSGDRPVVLMSVSRQLVIHIAVDHNGPHWLIEYI